MESNQPRFEELLDRCSDHRQSLPAGYISPLFALGYDTALRREELCSIQVSDIDPAHRMLRIRVEVTKNRLERVVPYSIHTSSLYQQYLQERRQLGNGPGRLFLSSSRRNRGQTTLSVDVVEISQATREGLQR